MNVVIVKLDADRCRDLVSASVLHAKLPDILVPFEVDLLWELNERALKGGDAATCTADEWRIVDDCLRELRAALSRYETAMEGMRLVLVEKPPVGERVSAHLHFTRPRAVS